MTAVDYMINSQRQFLQNWKKHLDKCKGKDIRGGHGCIL